MEAVENDIQAVMSGMAQGKLALQGLNPSGENPRGGPPPVDPAQKQFSDAIAALNALAQVLQRSGDMAASTSVREYAVKVQRDMVSRQQKIQKQAADQMQSGGQGNSYSQPFPNVNGGGTI